MIPKAGLPFDPPPWTEYYNLRYKSIPALWYTAKPPYNLLHRDIGLWTRYGKNISASLIVLLLRLGRVKVFFFQNWKLWTKVNRDKGLSMGVLLLTWVILPPRLLEHSPFTLTHFLYYYNSHFWMANLYYFSGKIHITLWQNNVDK